MSGFYTSKQLFNSNIFFPDTIQIGLGNTYADPDTTIKWDPTTGAYTTTISDSSSIAVTHNTETHRITNFTFKPIGSSITWANYAYGAAASLNFFRAQGTEDSETSIANGNILHRTLIWGYHSSGSAYIQGAEQRYIVDAAVGGSAEIPTRWELLLTPNGSTTPAIALSVSNAGDLTIGSGVAGKDYTLTFNGETNDGIITWMEDEDHFLFSDTIKASGGLQSSDGSTGLTTTFLNADGNTVTVKNGLITNIS